MDSGNPLDRQVGGAHYHGGTIQPVQYIEANGLGFLEGCVIKRLTRHGREGGKGVQDIDKAIHELQLLRALRYPLTLTFPSNPSSDQVWQVDPATERSVPCTECGGGPVYCRHCMTATSMVGG